MIGLVYPCLSFRFGKAWVCDPDTACMPVILAGFDLSYYSKGLSLHQVCSILLSVTIFIIAVASLCSSNERMSSDGIIPLQLYLFISVVSLSLAIL